MSEATTKVLVICTGNICRSPMAEVFLQDYAQQRGREVEVKSASLAGLNGVPAHKHSIKVMAELGHDLTNHRAQPVTDELIHWSDYVLVMEVRQAAKLRAKYPALGDKILLLGSFTGAMEIADPLGGWRWTFRKCRDQIKTCVEGFVDRL